MTVTHASEADTVAESPSIAGPSGHRPRVGRTDARCPSGLATTRPAPTALLAADSVSRIGTTASSCQVRPASFLVQVARPKLSVEPSAFPTSAWTWPGLA